MSDADLGTLTAKLHLDTHSAESSLKRVGGLFGSFGKVAAEGVAGVGAAMLGVGGMAVDMAIKYQKATTQLVTGAGETQKGLAIVQKGLLQMAGQVGESAQELARGMYLVESAGFHAGAGLQVMRIAAEGAKVGGADLTTVVDALTSGLNAYHLGADKAVQVTNTLIATEGVGKMHMEQLAGALGQVVPAASVAGVSLSEVGAAMATMTMVGVQADQAATFLRQTIISLEAPSAGATKVLKSLGLGSVDMAKELKKPDGLIEAIRMINEALDKKFPAASKLYQSEMLKVKRGTETVDQALTNLANNGAKGYVEALKTIAGGSKTMQGLLDLSGTHLQTLQANFDQINAKVKAGGTAIDGWNLITTTMSYKIDAAKAAIGAFLIKIGTDLLPVVTTMADWFTSHVIPALMRFSDWFTKTGMPAIGRFGTWLYKNVLQPTEAFLANVIPPLITGFTWLLTHLPMSVVLPLAGLLTTMWAVNKITAWGSAAKLAILGATTSMRSFLGLGAGSTGAVSALSAEAGVQKVFVTNWAMVGGTGVAEGGAAATIGSRIVGFLSPIAIAAAAATAAAMLLDSQNKTTGNNATGPGSFRGYTPDQLTSSVGHPWNQYNAAGPQTSYLGKGIPLLGGVMNILTGSFIAQMSADKNVTAARAAIFKIAGSVGETVQSYLGWQAATADLQSAVQTWNPKIAGGGQKAAIAILGLRDDLVAAGVSFGVATGATDNLASYMTKYGPLDAAQMTIFYGLLKDGLNPSVGNLKNAFMLLNASIIPAVPYGQALAANLKAGMSISAARTWANQAARTSGYAAGGMIGAGQTSWVGERGPELFTPQVPGYITPNNQLGGITQHNNFYGVGTETIAVVTQAIRQNNAQLIRTASAGRRG